MFMRKLLQGLAGAVGMLCVVGGMFGVQMANDADPFGTPPSRLSSAYGLAFSLCVAVGGARMASFRTNA